MEYYISPALPTSGLSLEREVSREDTIIIFLSLSENNFLLIIHLPARPHHYANESYQ